MPLIKATDGNSSSRINTGGDFNRAAPVIKDILHIVTSAEETSRIINTQFRYNVGINELEISLNGQLLRSMENIGGVWYGDYIELTNFSVQFQPGVLSAGDQVRFRVSANSYDYSNQNINNLTQLGKDTFGELYSLAHNGARNPRIIGEFVDGDTTPNISSYRTWKTANTADTYITNFDGGLTEDIRHIIFNDNNTRLIHGSGLNIYGGNTFRASLGDIAIAIHNGTDWDILSRLTIDATSNCELIVVDSTSASSGLITISFSYIQGSNDLKIFNNGIFMGVKTYYGGTEYGDYEETSPTSVTFSSGILNVGDNLRFVRG